MKAILCKEFGLPESLVLAEIPSPSPAKGQILISVKACGVNFPDTLMIQGEIPNQTTDALFSRR